MAQRTWGRELASRGAPWQKRAGCWQQKAGWGMRMEERRKPGGKKQREEGRRPMDTGPGPRKTKNKQTKTRTGQRRRGKRGSERARGGDSAEECGAGSGEEWVQGCRKGGAAHPTLSPTRASLSPCRRRGRAGRQKRCACCRHRCQAQRWSRGRTGSGPPRCSRPRSPHSRGADREVGAGTRCRGAGVGGSGSLTWASPASPLPLSPGPAPCLGPVPTPTPLGPAPKGAQPPFRPLLKAVSPLWNFPSLQPSGHGRPVCSCLPPPKDATIVSQSHHLPPFMVSSSQSSRSHVHSLRALPAPTPPSGTRICRPSRICPHVLFHPVLPFTALWASDPALETFPPGPALWRPCTSTATG